MTTQTNFPINDLVLRLSGGHRDGELIPVSTHKCFLGMEADSSGVERNPQCAIFRGPQGAAVRSYADEVLVNGVASTVHWLKEGDRIAFPNSMTVEVAQLGWVETQSDAVDELSSERDSQEPDSKQESALEPIGDEATDATDPESREDLSAALSTSLVDSETTESIGEAVEHSDSQSVEAAKNLGALPHKDTETASIEMAQYDERLGNVEIQIRDILASNELTQSRFEGLDSRIEDLVEKLSQLMANQTANASTDQVSENASFFTESSVLEAPAQGVEEAKSEAVTEEETFSEYYSHKDDGDEKIMTFDPTVDQLDTPAAEAENVQITDEEPVLSTPPNEELDQRLVEMERIFGNTSVEEEETKETQTVNEQPLEASETLAHSQDSEVALFTETTPEENTQTYDSVSAAIDSLETSESDAVENEGVDSFQPTELEPGSLASQLLAEVTSSEPEIIEQSVVDHVLVEPEIVEPEMVETEVTDLSQSESEVPRDESVADLLARMQMESGVEDDAEPEPYEPPALVQPEPVSAAVPVGEGSDDVEDYMNQLLNRMRGDEPAAAPKPVVKKAAPKADDSKEKEETFVPPSDPLTQAEFIPRQKATKLKSMDAMRELANSTARKAVQHSEDERLKALGFTQLGIAIASFLMALYYFMVDSEALFDLGFCIALICVATSGYLGTRFYNTMKYNERVAASPIVSATKDEAVV